MWGKFGTPCGRFSNWVGPLGALSAQNHVRQCVGSRIVQDDAILRQVHLGSQHRIAFFTRFRWLCYGFCDPMGCYPPNRSRGGVMAAPEVGAPTKEVQKQGHLLREAGATWVFSWKCHVISIARLFNWYLGLLGSQDVFAPSRTHASTPSPDVFFNEVAATTGDHHSQKAARVGLVHELHLSSKRTASH